MSFPTNKLSAAARELKMLFKLHFGKLHFGKIERKEREKSIKKPQQGGEGERHKKGTARFFIRRGSSLATLPRLDSSPFGS